MVEHGRLLHTVQQQGDDWLTRKLCVQILRKCLQRILFPSNTTLYFSLSLLRPVLCAFERQPIKNAKVAIWCTVHVHQAVLQPLYSGPSLLHADRPSSSTQAVPVSLRSHTFLSTRCFSAHYAEDSFLNGHKANALWSTADYFPYPFFFPKICRNEISSGSPSPSFKNTDIKIISDVSDTPS